MDRILGYGLSRWMSLCPPEQTIYRVPKTRNSNHMHAERSRKIIAIEKQIGQYKPEPPKPAICTQNAAWKASLLRQMQHP